MENIYQISTYNFNQNDLAEIENFLINNSTMAISYGSFFIFKTILDLKEIHKIVFDEVNFSTSKGYSICQINDVNTHLILEGAQYIDIQKDINTIYDDDMSIEEISDLILEKIGNFGGMENLSEYENKFLLEYSKTYE